MALRYNARMMLRQTPISHEPPDLPKIWLLSDARNDAVLETALAKLPRGSGFVFRHYHMNADARRARFDALATVARRHGHTVILSGSGMLACQWRADGIYGQPGRMSRAPGLPKGFLTLATAHNLPQIHAAERAGADAALLSPVFPTRSHAYSLSGVRTLGPVRFRLAAMQARIPIIALGGMDAAGAKRLGWPRWAAIDGLS